MISKLVAILACILVSTLSLQAQNRYSYCEETANINVPGVIATASFSDVFAIPVVAKVKIVGGKEFLEARDINNLFDTAARLPGRVAYLECAVYESRQAAETAKDQLIAQFEGIHVIQTHWKYKLSEQGTHIGGAKASEAEALYDAENSPGPFEKTGDGPIGYKTIHSWDNQQCSPRQVTGVHGSSKPQTYYECTVTFTYSDDKSPVARATLGMGDTQDDAVAAAKSLAQTALLSNVQWAQPFCSSFSVIVKNPCKADYGDGTAAKKERWACEIGFTGRTD
jgi:hypothetical protein